MLRAQTTPADSWQVDVAAELEAYLARVADTGSSNGNTSDKNLNFAEAALLLQNSTSIYTKKVEYVVALAQETLFQISTRKGGSSPGGGVSQGGTGRLKVNGGLAHQQGISADLDPSEPFTVPWSYIVQRPPSKTEDTEASADFGMHCKPSAQVTSADLAMLLKGVKKAARLPLLLMPPRDSTKTTKLSQGSLDARSGAVFADGQDLVTFAAELSEIAANLPSDSVESAAPGGMASRLSLTNRSSVPCSALAVAPPTLLSNGPPSAAVFPIEPGTAGSPAPAGGPAMAQMAARLLGDHPPGSTPQPTGASTPGEGVTVNEGQQRRVRFQDDLRDPWQRLDCHVPLGQDKPMRVGKPFREAKRDVYCAPAAATSQEHVTMVAQLILGKHGILPHSYLHTSKTNSADGCSGGRSLALLGLPDLRKLPAGPATRIYGSTWASFDGPYAALSRKAFGRRSGLGSGGSTPLQSVGDTPPRETTLAEDDENEDGPNWEEPSVVTADDGGSKVAALSPGGDDNVQVIISNNSNSGSHSEDLFKLIAATPSSQDKKALPSLLSDEHSALYARLADWRATISKLASEAHARPSFDVAVYKKYLATRIAEADQPTGVSFDELVRSRSRFDVCRYFLTTLVMCNEHDVALHVEDKPSASDIRSHSKEPANNQQLALTDDIPPQASITLSLLAPLPEVLARTCNIDEAVDESSRVSKRSRV